MRETWPDAVEWVALIIMGGLVALGYFGALPWQNRKRKP
jgi:hypothetical protein